MREQLTKKLLTLLSLKESEKYDIFDFGCGEGQLLGEISSVIDNGSKLIGIDSIEEAIEQVNKKTKPKSCFLIIDRVLVDHDDHDLSARIADSIQTAFYEGHGACRINYEIDGKKKEEKY